VNNVPGKGEVEKFWREVYGKRVQHNVEKGWIKKNQYQQSPSVE